MNTQQKNEIAGDLSESYGTSTRFQSNERYFLEMVNEKTKLYIWKDKMECFDMSSGKMKPYTLKGYVELSAIVRKPFMDLFVELPDNTMGMTKEQIWRTLQSI